MDNLRCIMISPKRLKNVSVLSVVFSPQPFVTIAIWTEEGSGFSQKFNIKEKSSR